MKDQLRFSKDLCKSGLFFSIPNRWEDLKPVNLNKHEQRFVDILKTFNLPAISPVPLVSRYSKPRKWVFEELDECVKAHARRTPIALMSAALNRNPQDIIFRLLDALKKKGVKFKENGLKSKKNLSKNEIKAGRVLFEAGLTAWRIAAYFGIDFEHAEKVFYGGRMDYGHKKKNPFGICTEHKRIINNFFITKLHRNSKVLDLFAGEGKFSFDVAFLHSKSSTIACEIDEETFKRGTKYTCRFNNVKWVLDNNINLISALLAEKQKFDVIDLDPFVTCFEQLKKFWDLLKSKSFLFITFGGEYRRSFIQTNRTAIKKRYGFFDSTLSNSEYLEIVPSYFWGWVAQQAQKAGFVLNLEYAVRYPNTCRFWSNVKKVPAKESICWFQNNVTEKNGGFLWKELKIPRFREVRKMHPELNPSIKSKKL